MLSRRDFIVGATALAGASSIPSLATGRVGPAGVFLWENGGSEPYEYLPETPLKLGLVRGWSERVIDSLISMIERGNSSQEIITDGWRRDVMYFGNNKFFRNGVIAYPSKWGRRASLLDEREYEEGQLALASYRAEGIDERALDTLEFLAGMPRDRLIVENYYYIGGNGDADTLEATYSVPRVCGNASLRTRKGKPPECYPHTRPAPRHYRRRRKPATRKT